MQKIGFLKAMMHLPETPVQYSLLLDDQIIPMNEWIGHHVQFVFHGQRSCIACGRNVKKLYNSGYCYPCFTSLAECDLCIVKPHECHFDQGTCRDESFAMSHCMVPHYVYLAFSNHVKVGLTRKSRYMARWMDQGAIQAIPIAELPTRKMAGELEVSISQHIPDKTDWRKMLKGDFADVDLLETLAHVKTIVPAEFQPYLLSEEQIYEFTYPLLEQIDKVKSLSFDKLESLEGRLIGIKGQYLLLDTGVLNIKKHAGYKVEIRFEKIQVEESSAS
ncbi:DUF2797 domain-containing protein [Fodinisporobacter ferrooxydans]|uniref:DUF2797 domain-containing protein n=1 Tax=Fodinisporobacter ferrooxydans TaxID=2901836 RepID=A0ABY4CH18_9BACL|nr:DUF2797 domain-containing protein [Alicyclobacillaceae bacterium MYW30-H2]